MTEARFSRESFQFLVDLHSHNEREWFLPNKERYQQLVQEPALELIRQVAPRLKKAVSRHYSGTATTQGGSLMRVYRDVRFSKDKSPYRTNVGMMFFHSAGKNEMAPGFYVHLEPMECFAGAGCWHPDPPSLLRIRKYLASHPKEWAKVLAQTKGELDGDRAARVPKGFPADHPYVEDLKRKDFITSVTFADTVAMRADFVDRVIDMCVGSKPLVRFLCRALGKPF